MTTDARILAVNFDVPDPCPHLWIVTCRTDICTIEGVPGRRLIRLTTGHFDLADTFPPAVSPDCVHAPSQFKDWLAASIGELRALCQP